MNLDRLKRQLEIDEGKKLRVYLDHLGYPTVGIGHLIKDSSPERIRGLRVGDKITEEECHELFIQDISIAVGDCKIIFDEWDAFPSEVQEILVNMLFNLGRPRFLTFKRMIAALYEKDWKRAAEEMADSRWAGQVGARATRLIKRMRNV
jgi:GH24 family phage-related lysozyme (muramidase)